MCSVPRVLFDGWTLNDFHIIFSSETAMLGLIDTIVSFMKVCRRNNSRNTLNKCSLLEAR